MAPVAAAVLVQFAANAVMSVFGGALFGAVVWRPKIGLILGVGGVIAYLLVAPGLVHVRMLPFAALNGPSMLMTFLICYVTARHLGIRRRWHPLGATLVAFIIALGVGALYVKLFGMLWNVSFWTPSWIATVADASLGVQAIRSQTFDPQRPAA